MEEDSPATLRIFKNSMKYHTKCWFNSQTPSYFNTNHQRKKQLPQYHGKSIREKECPEMDKMG